MTATLISAHYVLKIERGTPSVVRVCDDWTVAVSTQMVMTDERLDAGTPADECHYVVRQYNDTDGLVRRALDMKLSPRQGEVLNDLHRWFKRNPYKTWVRPGREHSWPGMYSVDMVAPAKALAARKLVQITGVPYGPKSYRLTRLGRFVAEHRVAVAAPDEPVTLDTLSKRDGRIAAERRDQARRAGYQSARRFRDK